MTPQDAAKMDLSTDYPLDKIIYITTGSFSIPGNDFVDLPIAHNLSFTPLMDGTYSTTPDFSISYDVGSGSPYASSTGFFAISNYIDADATNVNFHAINYTPSTVTVYYRFFGLMPSNVNALASFTSSTADDFVLNTDYNYTKLLYAGITSTDITITHNLGYRPQVVIWGEVAGTITKIRFSDVNNPDPPYLVKVTNTNVQINMSSSGVYACHYRIYLDN